MNGWIIELRDALGAEFGDRPKVGVLATVDRYGRPRGRSVVCRRIEDGGALWIASDRRSSKNGQVQNRPFAELVIWLPTRREQFRLAGHVSVLGPDSDDPRRRWLWRTLPDPTRAMFFWPPPGRPLDPDPNALPGAVPADVEPPDDFEVLILEPDQVEHLDLKPTPHRRRRWSAEDAWEEQGLNP
jgi:PPOX class probable FMN-dependent enzyme